MARLAFLVAIAMALGACNPTNVNPLAPLIGEADVLTAGRFAREVPNDPGPLYCYNTLGKVECYAEPSPEDRQRLRGYYGTPPRLWPYLTPGS